MTCASRLRRLSDAGRCGLPAGAACPRAAGGNQAPCNLRTRKLRLGPAERAQAITPPSGRLVAPQLIQLVAIDLGIVRLGAIGVPARPQQRQE